MPEGPPPSQNVDGAPRLPSAVEMDEAARLDARDLLLLHRTSRSILRGLNPGAIAQAVTDAIEELFGERRAASVVVQDPDGPRCLGHTRYGLDGEPLRPGVKEEVTALLRAPGAGGVIRWVMTHGRAVRLSETHEDARYLEHDSRVRSELCVPIPGSERPVGAINVESAHPEAFTERDETVLGVVANQLGVALENARLFQAMRRELAERRSMQDALRERDTRYRTLFESNPHPMWVYDRATLRFLAVNDAAVDYYGFSRDEFLAMTLRDIRPPEDVPLLERNVAAAPEGFDPPDLWRHRLKDGRVIHVEITSHRVDFDGHDAKLVLAHDVTERLAAEEEQRLHTAVVESTRDGIVVTGLDGRVLSVNRAFTEITGYPASAILDRSLDMILAPDDGGLSEDGLRAAVRREGYWQGERMIRRRDGTTAPTWLTLNAVRDAAGRTTHCVGIYTDISQLKAAQAETERLASFDALTGLPNRRLIMSHLERALSRGARHRWRVAVLYVDLDRFKAVNDSFGHAAGDELLCAVAARLARRLRQGDSIGRLGGDEFLVVLESVEEADDAARLARSLLAMLDGDLEIGNGRRVHVGASIGISVFPDDGVDAGELVRNADAAMYLAKDQGRHTCRFYSQALTVAAQERLALEMRLRAAVAESALTLHYQPIVSMDGARVLGAEALLRWTPQEGAPESPARFVPVAEDTGLIVPLGEWVLREACARLARWRDAGHAMEVLAVNVSARQLEHAGLVDTLRATLREHAIDPGLLELEITESGVMRRARGIGQCLRELKALGVRLAIDDFGTGYSSLAHLKRFPVDRLKIDRGFVMDIPGDGADLQIATAVISMAHSLGLEVTAEGVETETQRRILAERGCDAFQGFLVSPAVAPEEFERRFLAGK